MRQETSSASFSCADEHTGHKLVTTQLSFTHTLLTLSLSSAPLSTLPLFQRMHLPPDLSESVSRVSKVQQAPVCSSDGNKHLDF